MNLEQYLLIKLAEEASEVARIALKTAQFGAYEIYPGINETNMQRIHKELNDLNGIIRMLNNDFDFKYIPNEFEIENKIAKVSKYRQYSVDLGMVVPN